METDHAAALKKLNEEWEAKLAKKEADHANMLNSLDQERHKMQLKFMEEKEQLNSKIDDLNSIIDDLHKQIKALETKVKQREAEIQNIHDRVRIAEEKCEESMKEHQRRTKEIEVQFLEKEKLLQENLRKQMQRMVAEQTKDIEDMNSEFAHASQLMQDKYNMLSDRMGELQDLYEQRPSRPEDLEMVKDLNEAIVQKDAFIKKQEDDMKFYKLELINREQSYNQMFGTTPMLGGAVAPQLGSMQKP